MLRETTVKAIKGVLDCDITLSDDYKSKVLDFITNGDCADTNDRVVSYDEAAKILNSCKQTVCRYVRNGYIIGVGGCGIRSTGVSYNSLQRFIQKRLFANGTNAQTGAPRPF